MVRAVPRESIARKMQPKYEDIIIDVGGRDTTGLRATLTVADVAIVPFKPRSFDLWVLDKVVSLITEAGQYRISPLRACAILNFADSGGADNAAASEALSGNEVLSYLDCPIGNRKAFSHAAAEGRGVRELKRQDPKASAEIAAVVAAVFDNIEAISKR